MVAAGGEQIALLHPGAQVSSLLFGGNFIRVVRANAGLLFTNLKVKFAPVRALPPALPQHRPPHAPADSDLPCAAGRVAASLKLQATASGF